MKTIINKTLFAKIISLSLLIVLSTEAFGQLKIDAVGRVIVGPNNMTYFDPDTALSMSIQGKYTNANNAGSKLGFGDFGTYSGGWNVFLGEYGNTDSDILWLYGKNGIRITGQILNNVLMEIGCGPSRSGIFMQDIRTDRVVVSSDEASRSSVTQVSGALQRILQLSAVSYHNVVPESYYRLAEDVESESENNSTSRTGSDGAERSEKYIADSISRAVSDSIRMAGTDRYGFVTSELQQLFPNLVTSDYRGNTYIDYMGMIPLIVAALEEQQQTIEFLTAQLNMCCGQDDNSESQTGNEEYSVRSKVSVSDEGIQAELYQNSPNPFSQVTEIGYYLSDGIHSASIYIFSLNGSLVKTMPITSTGRGSVAVDASELAAGMYVYTLVADGNIIDSKRMILTE